MGGREVGDAHALAVPVFAAVEIDPEAARVWIGNGSRWGGLRTQGGYQKHGKAGAAKYEGAAGHGAIGSDSKPHHYTDTILLQIHGLSRILHKTKKPHTCVGGSSCTDPGPIT
jgi:hypothetical protein